MTVLSDLPILQTPYPTVAPLYDISGLMGAGVRRRAPGSVWAQITGNLVTVAVRAYTDAAEWPAVTLMEGLPAELSSAVNDQDLANQGLFLTPDGRIFLPGGAGWRLSDVSEVTAKWIAPRRQT